MDPIHQFQIRNLIGDGQFAFTNSSLFMVLTVVAIVGFLTLATQGRALIPGRWQSLAELSYEFVASTVRQSAGNDGMRFFPLVFSLFMFVLFANLFGMLPYSFTVTSHIIVTFGLAMIVISTIIIYGFAKHGTKFLHVFVPSGIPGFLLPLVVAIEVVSFLSRPISLSVRLFANMLAGHITLKVFAGFVVGLYGALGAGGLALGILPLVMTVALTGFEFFVAFVQAYVFTLLTCLYLSDALHPGH
jgi:F-type H+-transporting ATPase subunit a